MGRRFAELAFTPLVKSSRNNTAAATSMNESSAPTIWAIASAPSSAPSSKPATASTWPLSPKPAGPTSSIAAVSKVSFTSSTTAPSASQTCAATSKYISVGNLQHEDRVALFFMDYPNQSRLKILGHAKVHEGTAEARKLIEQLRMPDEKTPAERAFLIHIAAFDWNCPQHITPRYTEEELAKMLEPMRRRLEDLEAENKRLRGSGLITSISRSTPPSSPPEMTKHSCQITSARRPVQGLMKLAYPNLKILKRTLDNHCKT